MRFLDLGVLKIEHEGVVSSPGGHAPAAILSTLLLHLNRRVERDLLIDAVWGERVPGKAERTVATHLWRLRQVLRFDAASGAAESVIVNDTGGYRLSVPAATVSSSRFEQLTRQVGELLLGYRPDQALRTADEALDLWDGTPFSEVADRGWAIGPVARLEELHTQVRERRIEAILAAGDADRAIAECRRMIQEFPLRERLWAQLLLGYYRAGRANEALEAYQQARRVMLDETGLEPAEDLVELQRRILQRDPALQERSRAPVAAPASTVRLPTPRRLIGRAREVSELAGLVLAHPLVTVVGSAGCGKTAIAVEAARGLGDRFPDGVWFADLSTASAESDVPALVVAALGRQVPPAGNPEEALAAFAADRSALLVLDNCEQVLEQAARVCERVAAAGQGLSVLATSREELGVDAERVLRIDPLPSSPTGTVAEAASPAAQLFLERDRRGRTFDGLDEGDRTALGRICRAVDGLPLALELAAGWTRTYTLADIADQVGADPTGLAAVGRARARRHHESLFATIDHSYQLLKPAEQALHRRLSVLPGGFDRTLAIELAGEGLPARDIGGLLVRLAHRSLLRVESSGGRTSFAQLETIRSHAGHALAAAGEAEVTQDRRDRWTDHLLAGQPVLGSPGEVDWRNQVGNRLPVVRATLHRRLLVERDPRGIEPVCRLMDHWYFTGLIGEGLRWTRLAADIAAASTSGDDAVELAVPLLALAGLLVFEGSTAEASGVLADALAAARCEPANERLAWPLLKTAAAFSLAYDTAAMRRTLALAEPLVGSSVELTVAWRTIDCMADAVAGARDEVVGRARDCVAQAEELGNAWVAFLGCSAISASALIARDPELGLPWTRRAASWQRRLGARAAPQQYEALAAMLTLRGDLDAAVRVFSASYDTARGSGAAWPRNPASQKLLAAARRRMTKASFEQAWALGRTQDPLELFG